MDTGGIVGKLLQPFLEGLHAKRAQSLKAAVTAVVSGSRLSLSAIGRGLRAACAIRHRMKRADRLLGNSGLWNKRHDLYAAVARKLLAGLKHALIIIDWSNVTRDQKWHLLRASVAVEGRSVTLFEEVHPQKRYGDPRVHNRFLARLAALLPSSCRPIIMTDAGFRAAWFHLIDHYGWDWIGRIRNRDRVRAVGSDDWIKATSLYERATTTAQDLGEFTYVRSNPIGCRLALVKQKRKGRKSLNIYRQKRKSQASQKAARRAKEPWLLASSLSLRHLSAGEIVALYTGRMSIEQSFRDVKNERFGLGLSESRSRDGKRFEILLLVAHLAQYVMRIVGEQAKLCGLMRQFQSTSRISRSELSVIQLGRRILVDRMPLPFSLNLSAVINLLQTQINHAYSPA